MQYPIPEGWTAERQDDDLLVITAFDGPNKIPQSVTVDFTRRGFRNGVSSIGRFVTDTLYQGQGWKKRLVADAVRYLEASVSP